MLIHLGVSFHVSGPLSSNPANDGGLLWIVVSKISKYEIPEVVMTSFK